MIINSRNTGRTLGFVQSIKDDLIKGNPIHIMGSCNNINRIVDLLESIDICIDVDKCYGYIILTKTNK